MLTLRRSDLLSSAHYKENEEISGKVSNFSGASLCRVFVRKFAKSFISTKFHFIPFSLPVSNITAQ